MIDEVRQICGLRLQAPVALPQLRPSSGEPDVVFRITPPRPVPGTLPPGHPVVDWRTDDETIHWALSENAGGWSFRIPGFVDLAVNATADEAVITPHDEEAARFVPVLISEGAPAVIVNFSSAWGRRAAAEVAPYCASKFAIEGLTEALSQELPPNIGVVALNPGIIHTQMLESCFGSAAEAYPDPESWAQQAVPFLLDLSAADNGDPLTAPNATS